MRVDYIRDGLMEEFHEGIFVQFSKKTDDISSYPYYMRSCAKPLQATLLVDCNADLTEEELALCCGSHSGEECHLEVAYRIMKKFGITENMLKCGIHAPLSRTMQDKMLLRGEKPTQIHNNCSGKHLGFLVLCKINGWDVENYYELNHPLQQAVIGKIYELCDIKTKEFPITTDGCGVPIVSMPLYKMLVGYINLLKYDKIINSILKNPYIYGGENRTDTEIIQKTDGILAKVGAGGLCIVLNTKIKDAFVVKINDCSMEARRFAVLEMINRLGWGKIDFDNKIKTISGKIVGEVIVS